MSLFLLQDRVRDVYEPEVTANFWRCLRTRCPYVRCPYEQTRQRNVTTLIQNAHRMRRPQRAAHLSPLRPDYRIDTYSHGILSSFTVPPQVSPGHWDLGLVPKPGGVQEDMSETIPREAVTHRHRPGGWHRHGYRGCDRRTARARRAGSLSLPGCFS